LNHPPRCQDPSIHSPTDNSSGSSSNKVTSRLRLFVRVLPEPPHTQHTSPFAMVSTPQDISCQTRFHTTDEAVWCQPEEAFLQLLITHCSQLVAVQLPLFPTLFQKVLQGSAIVATQSANEPMLVQGAPAGPCIHGGRATMRFGPSGLTATPLAERFCPHLKRNLPPTSCW
jgi:hypothetical protein